MPAPRCVQIDWVEASNLEEATKTEDEAAYNGGCVGGWGPPLWPSPPPPRLLLPRSGSLGCLPALYLRKRTLPTLCPSRFPPRAPDAWMKLRSADGVLVPGGFGGRGVEGKILAAEYARTNDTPYLGICLGMQVGGDGGCRAG